MQEFIGKTFGKWVVTAYLGKFNRVHKFNVKCECGNESISDYIALTRGKSTKCRSCARKLHSQGEGNGSFRHGYSSVNHPQFHMHYIWCSIKQRCNNPKNIMYHNYGGRGIKMSPDWENSFEKFLEDMGERPIGYSVDRIDNEKGYCKENCRWATCEMQSNNQRTTAFHEYKGEKLSETQWSRKLGLPRNKIMWWSRKKGIEWVIENSDKLKKIKKGMSDKEYLEIGLEIPSKRFRDKNSVNT